MPLTVQLLHSGVVVVSLPACAKFNTSGRVGQRHDHRVGVAASFQRILAGKNPSVDMDSLVAVTRWDAERGV